MLSIQDQGPTGTDDAIRSLTFAMNQLQPRLPIRDSKQKLAAQSASIPKTSLERREASHRNEYADETVLYLAYGSNLAAETFLGKRGIRPLSQVNVVVPSIRLTFDLPGIPYSEPCFANSGYRFPDEKPSPEHPPYHKEAWKKGLVGVVYEVTQKDYAHIIATEGGGTGYHDVLVDCHVLSDDPEEEVPLVPSNTPFKAHTLYAPEDRVRRKDPDYAQPSARYLKLITDGAHEHNLPAEYVYFLANIRSYRAKSAGQKMGMSVVMMIWGPLILTFFAIARMFAGPDGKYPPWLGKVMKALFTAVWISYDMALHPLFGDGERTTGDDDDSANQCQWRSSHTGTHNEKTPLLADSSGRMDYRVETLA